MKNDNEKLTTILGSIGVFLAIIPAFKGCISAWQNVKNPNPEFGVPGFFELIFSVAWNIISPFLIFISILAIGKVVGVSLGKVIIYARDEKDSKRIQKKENIKKITKELRDIEKRIVEISSELDISFPVNYMNELMLSIENEDPNDTQVIQDIVNKITKKANDDLDNLIISNTLYVKVSDLINNARSKMIKIRERGILIEIHECFIDLNSDGVKYYLESKRWMDYNSYLNDIINYINDILKSVSDAQSKQSSMNNEMTEERAYKILGIKNNSSYKEIRRAYLQKIKEYHPDKVASLGDDLKDVANKKTQEITEAYNYLINNRNMI